MGCKNLSAPCAAGRRHQRRRSSTSCRPAPSAAAWRPKVALIRDACLLVDRTHARALAARSNGLDILIELGAAAHAADRGWRRPFETDRAAPSISAIGRPTSWRCDACARTWRGGGDRRRSIPASALMGPRPGRGRAHPSPRDLGFDLRHDALRSRDDGGRLAVLRGLREFQEHLGGEPTVTLLAAIGRASTSRTRRAPIARSIEWLFDCRRAHGGNRMRLEGLPDEVQLTYDQHPRGRVLGRAASPTRTFRTIKGAVSPDAPFGPDSALWPRRRELLPAGSARHSGRSWNGSAPTSSRSTRSPSAPSTARA